MTTIKLYKSYNKSLRLLGGSILFIIIGIWMIRTEPSGSFEYIIGWMGSCFFGLGLALSLFHLIDRRPQIAESVSIFQILQCGKYRARFYLQIHSGI